MASTGRRASRRIRDAEQHHGTRDAIVKAAAAVSAIAGLFLLGLPTGWALACVAAVLGLASWESRQGWLLGTASIAIGIASTAVLLHSAFHHDRRPTVTPLSEPWPTDLATATDPSGFYPARPGLKCAGPATCGVGNVPMLNTLVFGDGGFPQGIPDERRFLTAQVIPEAPVHPIDDLRPTRDPLSVRPGEAVRITGIIDNAGTPSTTSATAREVRALIALPAGNGVAHTAVSSVAAYNADPSVVSDSVTIKSTMPTYLRYKPGTASVTRLGATLYSLSDQLVTTYGPGRFDRRELADHGVRVGCSRPDGVVPAGRSCALRFQADFDVRYAATPGDVNGIGGLERPPFEVFGRVRSNEPVWLHWMPRWGALSDLVVRGGSPITLECVLYTRHGIWYHVPDAAVISTRDSIDGYDTAFIAGRDVVDVHSVPTDCHPPSRVNR